MNGDTTGLQTLVDTLGQIRDDDDVLGDAWLEAVVEAFLCCPASSSLDDWFYEILLTWAGFCLDDPESLNLAQSITELLLGTGWFSLTCSHADEPSLLCERRRNQLSSWGAVGLHLTARGTFVSQLEQRHTAPDSPTTDANGVHHEEDEA